MSIGLKFVRMLMSFGRAMVSLIPRLSSFAVSGTPARAQVSDLMHVLRYSDFLLPMSYVDSMLRKVFTGGQRYWLC